MASEREAPAPESLADLLGGWRSAVETAVPLVGFAAGWLAGGHSIPLGAGVAVLAGAAVAAWRITAGRRPLGTVFIPLWWAGSVLWLTAAQTVLTWPLVAACLAVSWWVLRRALPPGHPGIRHPQSHSPADPQRRPAG
ncbi:DUF3159 domain-containing protein [Dactylosporangium matsuzakiense]|uniref:Uncharacterized protein n=1 Tax=Dactylosporangium matsuzakiense TaxID=53360 RepID=A0A9W6NS04_9ACTN|nr:DUF3159 domain-containing protein [Dactylosporangium matsuzakiense]UWZ41646.1 hypothetical protein Dmats_28830 [Dactylosporangium matsuzakiense]GLL06687.1 hypothetical protein GCM10017581_084370 [Dactylosporangium matsuzakiense]